MRWECERRPETLLAGMFKVGAGESDSNTTTKTKKGGLVKDNGRVPVYWGGTRKEKKDSGQDVEKTPELCEWLRMSGKKLKKKLLQETGVKKRVETFEGSQKKGPYPYYILLTLLSQMISWWLGGESIHNSQLCVDSIIR